MLAACDDGLGEVDGACGVGRGGDMKGDCGERQSWNRTEEGKKKEKKRKKREISLLLWRKWIYIYIYIYIFLVSLEVVLC